MNVFFVLVNLLSLPRNSLPSQFLLATVKIVKQSPNVLVFEPNDRIASTTTTTLPDGSKTFRVSINTNKIQSAGLFYNVLLHELGHVYGRKDLSGDIMDFTVIKNTRGQLFQHSPYYKTNFPYPYYAQLNWSGLTVERWS